MKTLALIYFASMFSIGVTDTQAGRFTRMMFVAMPLAAAHVGTLEQATSVIHWHL